MLFSNCHFFVLTLGLIAVYDGLSRTAHSMWNAMNPYTEKMLFYTFSFIPFLGISQFCSESDWLFQRAFNRAFQTSFSSRDSTFGPGYCLQALCFFQPAIPLHLWTLNFICCFIVQSHSTVWCHNSMVVQRVRLQTLTVLFLNTMNYFIINKLFHICSHHFYVVYEHNGHIWTQWTYMNTVSNTVHGHKLHHCQTPSLMKTLTIYFS